MSARSHQDTTPDLAALIGSRICHDLVNPLGALGNGVELLEMTQEPSAELALMAQSVAQAQGMLRLFRLAFGAARADQQVTGQTLRAALDALASQGPHEIDSSTLTGQLPRTDARLIALLLLCCKSAMPWGGQITLAPDGQNWLIAARTRRLQLEAPLWQSLADPASPQPAPSPAQVHFALVRGALAASGRRLALRLRETTIDLSL